MNRPNYDKKYMAQAIQLADIASENGDVPVGALVVDEKGIVIGEGYNRREMDGDPVAHAEIVALKAAAKARGNWRLDGCRLYVTLEPCSMCAGAIVNSRISELIYGAEDLKAGAIRSLYAICEDPRLNHRVSVRRGVLAEQCASILTEFFESKRKAQPKVDH